MAKFNELHGTYPAWVFRKLRANPNVGLFVLINKKGQVLESILAEIDEEKRIFNTPNIRATLCILYYVPSDEFETYICTQCRTKKKGHIYIMINTTTESTRALCISCMEGN